MKEIGKMKKFTIAMVIPLFLILFIGSPVSSASGPVIKVGFTFKTLKGAPKIPVDKNKFIKEVKNFANEMAFKFNTKVFKSASFKFDIVGDTFVVPARAVSKERKKHLYQTRCAVTITGNNGEVFTKEHNLSYDDDKWHLIDNIKSRKTARTNTFNSSLSSWAEQVVSTYIIKSSKKK